MRQFIIAFGTARRDHICEIREWAYKNAFTLILLSSLFVITEAIRVIVQ